MKIFLIDFENVHSDGLNGVDLLSENDEVVIFYSNNGYTNVPQYYVICTLPVLFVLCGRGEHMLPEILKWVNAHIANDGGHF